MKKTVTIALYAVRLGGVAALALGLAIRLGLNIPLHIHMGIGGLTLLAFLALAVAARKCSPVLLSLSAVLLVPLFGLAQILPALAGLSPLSEWIHPVLAVVALGLAERTARASRSA